MSWQLRMTLEYDNGNPKAKRNKFLCKIEELEYSAMRRWDALQGTGA